MQDYVTFRMNDYCHLEIKVFAKLNENVDKHKFYSKFANKEI